MAGAHFLIGLLILTFITCSDSRASRYNPDLENTYRLYTRVNRRLGDKSRYILTYGDYRALNRSDFNPKRRTIVVVHGWLSYTHDGYRLLIETMLNAKDVNVIEVDWKAGSNKIYYTSAMDNCIIAGKGIARFIEWVNDNTGASPDQYHIVGNSMGAHLAGLIGRFMNGTIGYITALDPAAPGFVKNDQKFRPSDGIYTEVIHTNAGFTGFNTPLGKVDFYPNGGAFMPGCSALNAECNHFRAFYFFEESIRRGGFTGRRCPNYRKAMVHDCHLKGKLKMGGLKPKTGRSGIYWLDTNDKPPFSKG